MAKIEARDIIEAMASTLLEGPVLAIDRGGGPLKQVVNGKALYRVVAPNGDLLSWTRARVMKQCVAVYPLTHDLLPLDDGEAGKAMLAAAMK